ncbi:hypothetical protein, partial [Brucella ceti]|uniref:hypothetical protein n=1 Tax=Brucella ceti TaxID=120577 RepID=UPI0035D3EB8B
ADLVRLLSERIVWHAIATSLALGFSAALLAVFLSLALVAAREGHGHCGIDGDDHQWRHDKGIGEMAQQDKPARADDNGRHDE